MNQREKDLFTERAAKALEGIEMLLAMWIEKSVEGAELWVGESPDMELSRRAWRELETTASKPFEKTPEPPAIDRRLQHIEERLSRLESDLAVLEARVHEEQPE
jgi:hypothetical protein